jgi:hypothetical protein
MSAAFAELTATIRGGASAGERRFGRVGRGYDAGVVDDGMHGVSAGSA